MTDYEKIRLFENNILDKYHEKYLFYRYSEDIVIPYLLQIYGDTERHRDNLIRHGHNDTNLSFYLNNMLHGLGHCIRWMIRKNNTGIKDISGITYRQIHEMAADFLSWGTGYHMIVQEFVTWSRKIKPAILDEKEKTITFLNPEGFDYSKVYDNQLIYASQMEAIYQDYPHDEMINEFDQWVKEIDFKRPPIANHVKWSRARNSKSYPQLYLRMKKALFPELEETTDLQGYNVKQLRQFYALVFLNFHFIRWVEGMLDAGTEPNKLSYGSNPLYLSQKNFEKLISDITGFDIEVSRAIIADLTFNPSNLHTSVTIQPFICSSNLTYYILPNLFAQLEPSRMILGALNKGGKKKKYDGLINTIEKVNLRSIYSVVKDIRGMVCYMEKLIKSNNQQIHPDLILIDTTNNFLLVADYKHFIGPITASEVDYKMKELEKAINQVGKYIERLTKLSMVGSIKIQGFYVVGLIITHKPLPVPIPKENIIPIVDLETFLETVRLVIKEKKGVVELTQRIQENYTKVPNLVFEDYESVIDVDDWKIRRMQHKLTNNL